MFRNPLNGVAFAALAVALALLRFCPGGRAWSLTLAGGDVFYALFGVLRLGVALGLPLLGGAVGLIVRETWRPQPHAALAPG